MKHTCQACTKEHAWMLVSSHYDEICGECVKNDPRVDFCPQENRYALFGYCRCGDRGPVNYGRFESEFLFYCGGPYAGCRP